MAYTTILFEQDGAKGKITLNRPDVLNSINREMIDELRDVLKKTAADPSIRVLLLTGSGRGFCAGADLAAPGDRDPGMSVGQGVAKGMEEGFNPLARELAGYPKPVIAAVNGTTAGGGVGLALCADIVIAGRSASFIQVFTPRLGLVPDVGCTWFMPRLVGRARARALALTGDKLSAEKAADWGLIWDCVDDDKLLDEANRIADHLAKGPPNAHAKVKEILDRSEFNTLSEQLDLERDIQGELGDHPNFAEGVKAFLTKQEPKFAAD